MANDTIVIDLTGQNRYQNNEVKIDTSKIPPHRARAIGRAFYYAYMDFIKDPENEKMIMKRAAEIREEMKRKEKEECTDSSMK